MYKVFLNDRIIEVSPRKEIRGDLFDSQLVYPSPGVSAVKIFNYFLKSRSTRFIILGENHHKFWHEFRANFINIRAAGGVVRKGNETLFIFRLGKWDLPKGKIDKGETCQQAALREVEEECGISGMQIIKQLPPTWHIYQSEYGKTKGKWVFKETSWFEMEYCGDEKLVPQEDEGIVKAEWKMPEDFDEILKNIYKSLESLIKLYF